MNKPFYITTPLYYVNDTPHIGHAYTTIVADVLARYHRLFGEETFFLTGTDEHGQKIQNAADKANMPPKSYVDQIVGKFQAIWKELEIDHDLFMRTTFDYHERCVQACLDELHKNGDIYAQDYDGWYSVSEEIFYTEKDLIDGKTPQGNDVTFVKERNYFFKMSKYRDALLQHIEANPHFIQPDNRRNEVLGFLRKPLEDLCISRPKSRLSWGIELPFDKNFVTYVWFDALLNYASGVGFKQAGRESEFQKFWPQAIHLLGKDILITHSVYWTTMLLALKTPLPKQIFAHGWWLTESSEKMSKSKGTVVKPLDVKEIVGVDGLRYFLTRDIHFGNDAQFSTDLVISRVNSELANNLGNLLSRSTNLISTFFNGHLPNGTHQIPESRMLAELGPKTATRVYEHIYRMEPNLAVGAVVELLSEANRYLENHAPWKSAKTDPAAAGEVLYHAIETLRVAATLLSPVMPSKMSQLLKIIGWTSKPTFQESKSWGLSKPGTPIAKPEPLFPRVETPRLETAGPTKSAHAQGPAKPAQSAAPSHSPAGANWIEFDDFAKVDLRVARIIEAEAIAEADKLLRLKVDLGTEQRTIIAGIKSAYAPDKLVGRNVVVVANLKPRKMKFGVSEGMVLAAGPGGPDIFVVSPDSGAKPGDQVK